MKKKVLQGVTLQDIDFIDTVEGQIERVQFIRLEKISIEKNIRFTYDGIDELAQSIEKHGLLQAIIVQADEHMQGIFNIVCGHRRYLASRQLFEKHGDQYEKIKCIVKSNLSPWDVLELQVTENVQQNSLKPLELKNALDELRKTGLSNKEVAKRIGKSEKFVRNAVSALNNVDNNPELKELVQEHPTVTVSDLQEISPLPAKEQVSLIKQKLEGALRSRTELREAVRSAKETIHTHNVTRRSVSYDNLLTVKDTRLNLKSISINRSEIKAKEKKTLIAILQQAIKFLEGEDN